MELIAFEVADGVRAPLTVHLGVAATAHRETNADGLLRPAAIRLQAGRPEPG